MRYLSILWPDSKDIESNKEKRQSLEKCFLSAFKIPMKVEFPNTHPFSTATRAMVRFDLFAQNCLRAEINPYRSELFKQEFADWSEQQFGLWVSGIRPIPELHWYKLNRFFEKRLGNDFVKFWPTDLRLSDLTMLELGYLAIPEGDEHCTDQYWAGDRTFASGDKRLVLSQMCVNLPLFRYLGHQKWVYNPALDHFQLERTKGRVNMDIPKYLKACSHYARKRFKFWKLHKKLIEILRSIDERRERRQQLAKRLTETFGG
jgi:hypothetical protein